MPSSNEQQSQALQKLVKFLLKENIDNSFEILKLHEIIHDNIKMKKKKKKKFEKQTSKLLSKIDDNIKLFRRISKRNES